MDFDAFADLAEAIADSLPPKLLEGLSGGIIIEKKTRRRSEDPPGVYLLGEYITEDYLGPLIAIYYGSFRRVFAGEPPEVWEEELRRTLLHEVRHHLEARAGVDDLGREDLEELARLWQEWLQGPGGKPSGSARERRGGGGE